jgi:hypothetical protein
MRILKLFSASQNELHFIRKAASMFVLYQFLSLRQWSQTRGPREGSMRPANIRKNGDFKRNIGPIGLFSQKHCILTQKNFFIFLMRPARPYFQSHAARVTL